MTKQFENYINVNHKHIHQTKYTHYNIGIENEIDDFQRNLLRKIVGIKYPFIIRNEILYKRTNEKPWSNILQIRRLRWVGHMMRLPENAPLKLALTEACKHSKGFKNNNIITWIKTVKKDLKSINEEYFIESVHEGRLADDREWWERKIFNETSAMLTMCLLMIRIYLTLVNEVQVE